MATAARTLYQGQPANTATTLYTVPSDTQTIIKSIHIVNPTIDPHTICLWQAGNSDENMILPPVTLGPGEFATYNGDIMMETTDTLQSEAGAVDSITVTVHGVEITP